MAKTLTFGCLALILTLAGLYFISFHEEAGQPPGLADCSLPPVNDHEHPGMAWIPGGSFNMGSAQVYLEEGPVHPRQMQGFWMDIHEVTNRQFSAFVDATGYRTLAERGSDDPDIPLEQRLPGSAAFMPAKDGKLNPFQSWWRFIPGANWRHPEGPDSNLDGRENHPVVHIAYEDAQAYADWAGKALPTEAQFEYAAQGSGRKDDQGNFQANTWQGLFPFQQEALDGFSGTAPAACYSPNRFGLYDMIGNVWEWTASPFYASHDFAEKASYPEGFDPRQPGEKVAVIKGGSYLCAPNYCMRYRPEARQGQSKGLGTNHIGFRTVINP